MAEYQDREHYLPLRKGDLVELLCKEQGLAPADREGFRQFCTLIAAVMHFEYHQRLEELTDLYAPFDPDSVTKPLKTLGPEERLQQMEELFRRFEALMERANFKKVDQSVLAEANRQASLVGVRMYVDFRIFEKLAAFSRSESTVTRTHRHWLYFWRKVQFEVLLFQRLAVIAKMRGQKKPGHGALGILQKWMPKFLRRSPLGDKVNTDCVYLKIFKDVPRMDLEMLLPGARLRMPGLQRLKLGGSWIGGLAYLMYSLSTEVFEALTRGVWFVVYGPLAALLGYGYKQWYGYQSTKTAYGLRLSQSLYYQTLDSNAGVIHHLLDEAEEQDCREAMLAYFYLRHAGDSGWTSAELDDFVEENMERLTGIKFDFEIGDALEKLERHKLVVRSGDRYRTKPMAKALEMLDYTWDNYFKFNNPEYEAPPAS